MYVCMYLEFMLYLVTRLPNPHFSPEEQSKCTIVDFTVTQKGSLIHRVLPYQIIMNIYVLCVCMYV